MWYILLLLIDSVATIPIYYKAIPGYLCSENYHCVDRMPNAMCFNNKCVCQIGFKPDGFSRCIDTVRYRRQINFGTQMLGEECQSNDECRRTPVDGTKVCVLGQCQCAPGHIPVDAFRCIRDFEQMPSDTQVTKSYEMEEFPGYGSSCLIHTDCQSITIQLECFQGTCACLEGYVPLGKYLCYNIRGQQDEIVTQTSTITSTTSTKTSIFHLPNDEAAKSLGKLGNICTDDYYCRRSVTNSHCYNGRCACIDSYISTDSYTCSEDKKRDLIEDIATYNSLIDGKCKTNLNCYVGDSICLNDICTCRNGYYPIDNWHCLPDADSSSEELGTKSMITFPTTTIITTTTTTTTIRTTTRPTITTVTTTTSTTTTTTMTTSIVWWPWSSSSSSFAVPTTTTTNGFPWWSWLSSPTTRKPLLNLQNTNNFRCVLHRHCISMDRNSHCSLFGRCVCNYGFRLHMTIEGQLCVRKITDNDENDDDCD